MKPLLAALTLPGLAMARPVTLATTMHNHGGDGACLAPCVTGAAGAYVGSLWMAGGKSNYYEHLSGWHAATGGDPAQENGITGASVGAGRTLEITLYLADTLFDAGYTLHIDAAVEDVRNSPNEISVPLTSAGAAARDLQGGIILAVPDGDRDDPQGCRDDPGRHRSPVGLGDRQGTDEGLHGRAGCVPVRPDSAARVNPDDRFRLYPPRVSGGDRGDGRKAIALARGGWRARQAAMGSAASCQVPPGQ